MLTSTNYTNPVSDLGSIQNQTVYVLIPERLCTAFPNGFNEFNLRAVPGLPNTHCFADLICRKLIENRSYGKETLAPVTWLNLTLEPAKIHSVVAAVVPVINYMRKYAKTKNMTSQKWAIESLPSVKRWKFHEMSNLRVLVFLQWPDPAAEVFQSQCMPFPSTHVIQNALKYRRCITLGSVSTLDSKCYLQFSRADLEKVEVFCHYCTKLINEVYL